MLELTRREVARCYLAVRPHPSLGLLLKVGSSIKPESRISDLGAKPILDRWMPYAHESDIKRHLRRWRAWPDDRTKWIKPVFTAHSEWFLWNATSRHVLNAYFALQTAKGSTDGTLEQLLPELFPAPDPEDDITF